MTEKIFDMNGVEIKVEDNVIWHDPETSEADLKRIWTIDRISEEVINISDKFSEAEVLSNELEKVRKYGKRS